MLISERIQFFYIKYISSADMGSLLHRGRIQRPKPHEEMHPDDGGQSPCLAGGDAGQGTGRTQKSVKSVHSLDCGLEYQECYGAAAGNRTRVTSLEGSNLNHLTTAALLDRNRILIPHQCKRQKNHALRVLLNRNAKYP